MRCLRTYLRLLERYPAFRAAECKDSHFPDIRNRAPSFYVLEAGKWLTASA